MSDNNQDPNSNAAFSQQSTGAQSNPFTSELKGEFTSDFGTNTNAVSQIFKGGGFASENKSRVILLVLFAIVLGVAGYFYMADSASEGDEAIPEEVAEDGDEAVKPDEEIKDATAAAPTDAEKPADAAATDTAAAPTEAAPVDAGAAASASTGAIKLLSPANGASQSYDETQGVSEFTWEGPADEIVFSRSKSMSPIVKSVKLNGASKFNFENPYPGTWYWQVKNASGDSDVSTFTISAPQARNFPVSAPTPGGQLSGNGGVVSWQAGEKIARYSVELTPAGSSFANPSYRFGTSGTSVAIQGVSPGAYDFRVGAFSEVAGRWEWQVIQNVSVQ